MRVEWEGKMGQFVDRGPGWVHGVVSGIETGRQRIAQERPMSLDKLNVRNPGHVNKRSGKW
jgi:hypothetical protein